MPRSLLAVSLAILAAGCEEAPPPPRGTVVAELHAEASPRARALTFRPARMLDDSIIHTSSIDFLPISSDGAAGSGPLGTVELVTNSVGDTLAGDPCPSVTPGVGAFCANVTLNQFYPRPLSNVFVQVASITSASGAPISGHRALFDDPSELGLDASFGLWKVTAPASTVPGVLGAAPDNGGARDWVFDNPDDADTMLAIRVIASLTYASYTRAATSLPFVDACAGGTNLGTPTATTITLPFPFTLYDTTSATLTVNRRGVIVVGASGLIAPAKSAPIPASGNVPGCTSLSQCAVPRPAIFAFWDGLIYMGNGAICTQVGGAAPNRTFAITWAHVERSSVADLGSDYTFTAVLHEGTDVIDLLYGSMLGPQPNASGGSATIGVQNAAGTVATGQNKIANVGSGAAYTFTPVP